VPGKIKLAIAGVGNCASSLAQGIEYYKHMDAKGCIGLMHYEINGYRPGDIEVVAAFDVDKRKVGKDLSEAVFAEPNCTAVFYRVPYYGVEVKMGNRRLVPRLFTGRLRSCSMTGDVSSTGPIS